MRPRKQGLARRLAGVLALGCSALLPISAATPATASAAPAMGFYRGGAPVGILGHSLTLNGKVHDFVGVDAYQLATDWGVNAGCGGMYSTAQLDQLFAGLPPGSLVRVWAFEGALGTDYRTHQIDWTGLDRVMTAAAKYHQYVILSLTDQGGGCDGDVWYGPSWYLGGYRQVQNPTGATPVSYWDYVTDIVEHFRSSPALAMWEPISEAEASTCPTRDVNAACVGGQTCPDEHAAAVALRGFFTQVGEEIQRLDPRHPVEDGLLSGGQCGTQGADWAYVSESPGINVLSYHDYYGAGARIGGDQWNGIAVRLTQARSVDKPVIAGELGIEAGTTAAGCPSLAARAGAITEKADSQFSNGSSAVLLWNEELDAPPLHDCSYNVTPGDPALAALARIDSTWTAIRAR